MTTPQQQEPTPLPELAVSLAIAHQAAQEAVASQVAAGLAILWPALSFASLAATSSAWLHAVALEIERGWVSSIALSKRFVQETLWAVEPGAGDIPDLPLSFPFQKVQDRMNGAGPNRVKHATKAAFLDDDTIPLEDLKNETMGTAKDHSTGVGQRLALDGGLEATKQSLILAKVTPESELIKRRQERTIGWARFTDSDPCYFCAILASLGAVFEEDSFLASGAKHGEGKNPAAVHPNCQCSMRAVFRMSDRWDDRALLFKAQWEKFSKGHSNYKPDKGASDAMNAFRRSYIKPPPYPDAKNVDLGALRRNRQALIDAGFEESHPQVAFYDDQITRFAA